MTNFTSSHGVKWSMLVQLFLPAIPLPGHTHAVVAANDSTDLGSYKSLEFYAMQFVGNEWRLPTQTDTLQTVRINASTVNTRDNPEYLADPSPVPRQEWRS